MRESVRYKASIQSPLQSRVSHVPACVPRPIRAHLAILNVAIVLQVGLGHSIVLARVVCEPGLPQQQFAASELEAVLRDLQLTNLHVCLRISQGTGPAESFEIRRAATNIIEVLGPDPVGCMYGGLEVAERLRLRLPVEDMRASPYIEKRGIKFNIPPDLRTPSYSDCSDAAQANIPVMWEPDFWMRLLDAMARYRYNVLTLWNLHPFPSLVRVPEFPDVALNDVWRTRTKLDDSFEFNGKDMVRPEMLAQHEVVRRITMDEKISFWRWILEYAHNRGIEVYWFTWNIFTFGAEGKYGITPDIDNETTKRYVRASVRELVKTYPLLAGIGITAGEGMPARMDPNVKERWLWDTYGEGIRDALRQEPGRRFRLIHRFHWTSQQAILDAFRDYPGPFDFSFKYSVAHMYSIPNPPFVQPLLDGLAPGKKTWLTLRNDDIYTFRFGDPAYVRDYILHLPPREKLVGFYMGPDGYTWGRDFLERAPGGGSRPLVIEKQWYSFLLWGRLAYDPTIPDSRFEQLLAARHPQAPSSHLFRALQAASQVMPLITRFFWRDIDLKWYPEACWSHPRHNGFYTVRHFMEGVSMPGANVLSIRDWRARVLAGQPVTETTPLQIAERLDTAASNVFAAVHALQDAACGDSELAKTMDDCTALAWLGRYYADKIRGACALAMFDATRKESDHQNALKYLEQALASWRQYAAVRDARYVPALYNRVGYVDVTALTQSVAADLEIARGWTPGTLKGSLRGSGTEKGFRP